MHLTVTFQAFALAPALVLMGGCAKSPPSLSPRGQQAFYAQRVVQALDVMRDYVVAANGQEPPLFTEAGTRRIVVYHRAALLTINELPDGWVASVKVGLVQVFEALSPADQEQLRPYFQLAEVLLNVADEVTR